MKWCGLSRQRFPLICGASRAIIAQRFDKGHLAIGANQGGRLVGVISSYSANFCPFNFLEFPKTFREFSNYISDPLGDSVAIYSFGIHPSAKNIFLVTSLIDTIFRIAKADQRKHVFGEGRVASYGGTDEIRRSNRLRAAINRFAATGRFPSESDFMSDPILAMYRWVSGCRFHWLIPNFAPTDLPSSGWRVILYNTPSSFDQWTTEGNT